MTWKGYETDYFKNLRQRELARRVEIAQLRNDGVLVKNIAFKLGISVCRIWQIEQKALREKALANENKSG